MNPRRGKRARVVAAFALLFVVSSTFAIGGLASSKRPGDVPHYARFGERVLAGEIPYHDFYVEYPPGALPTFVLPVALADDDFQLAFKLMMVLFGLVALAACARAAHLTGRGRELGHVLTPLALLPALLGHVALNRYDLWPTMLTVGAVTLLLAGRIRLSAAVLALAFSAKIFAAAALPVVAVRIWRTKGIRSLVGAAAVFAAVCLLVFLPFAVVGFGGLGFSLYSQATRDLQSESLAASLLLAADQLRIYDVTLYGGLSIDVAGRFADALAVVSSGLQVVAVLAAAWLYLRGEESAPRLVAAATASIVGFTVFAKVLSPQFLIWLVPLVPLVGGRAGRLGTPPLVVALVLTQLYLYGIDEMRFDAWAVWLLLARNVLLVAVLALLLWSLWTQYVRPTPSARRLARPRVPRSAAGSARGTRSRGAAP